MSTSRRGTREKRCPDCMVHRENCFCQKIKTLSLRTRVSILIFRKEIFLPSNTAHLTMKSLKNSQQYERGHLGKMLDETFLSEDDFQTLYLFPSEDAIELTTEFIKQFKKPINLIVPDGTWRQAKKVQRREKLLNNIIQVKITPDVKSIYPLRRQKFDSGLCTHEAIAYALEKIEGEDVKKTMMNNLKIFIDAHLVNRVIFNKTKLKK